MQSAVIYAGLALVFSFMAEAHIAMYNKGLFGYNAPNQASDSQQNYNANWVVAPLRQYDNLTQAQWFAHGMLDYPPKDGDFMELVSGSNYTGELACNRAWTHMRNPASTAAYNFYACPDDGPLHTRNKFNQTPNDDYFGGTAIGIAYTSDEQNVHPNDFTVISVNYTGAWFRETIYQIPEGMPKCPSGGCLCTWNWFHQAGHGEGYGFEFYNTLYRCTVSGKTSNDAMLPLGTASLPVLCPNNTDKCVTGPKMPMYIWMTSGNNMQYTSTPPSYNARYGFTNGAQANIFGQASESSDARAMRALPAAMVVLGAAIAGALAPAFM